MVRRLSGGVNLEDGDSCGFSQASDQINVAATGLDPALADNGGPTLTHALLPGSPAIDQGNSFGLTTDQRGDPRPVDFSGIANAPGEDGTDIGAFEVESACMGETSPSLGCHTLALTVSVSGLGTVTSLPAGVNCDSSCARPFGAGSSVVLTATPQSGSTFAGWSGGGCSGIGTCTVALGSDQSITATFNTTPPRHTLTLTKTGTGSGSVTSSPAGVDCGQTCSHAYDAGTRVTLTATPLPGSTFGRWSGGGCGGTRTCVLTIGADTSVSAAFALTPAPALSALRVSPHKFVLTGRLARGRCVAATHANRNSGRCTRALAFRISYRLTTAARVSFTVEQIRNHRFVPYRGTIARSSPAGASRFTFNGRIGSRRLGPSSYRLTATTQANGRTGKSQTIRFEIGR